MRATLVSCSAFALCTLIAACGDGGSQSSGGVIVPPAGPGSPTPTPTPTPTPSPSPTPFAPVIGSIFADPTLTSSFRVVGRGWQSSTAGDGSGLVAEGTSEDVAVTYAVSTASYQMAFPLLAANTMYRTSEVFYDALIGGTRYEAALAATPSTAANRADIAVIRLGPSGAPYEYTAWLPWITSNDLGGGRFRYSSGVAGIAQFTPNAQVPRTGTRRYVGRLVANMSDNLADFVVGRVELDIDFAVGTASGTLYLKHACMMGCDYPEVAYRLADIAYSTGGPRFDGKLSVTGLPADGAIAGGYAGPNAEELMLSFRTPYYNPDWGKSTLLSGIGLARRL